MTSSSAHDVTSTSSKTLDSEQLNDDDVVEGTEGVDDLMLLAEFAGRLALHLCALEWQACGLILFESEVFINYSLIL